MRALLFSLLLVTTLLGPTIVEAEAAPPTELLNRLPAQGVRFATQLYAAGDDQHRFMIVQVDSRGLTILTEENHADYHTLYWVDHQTLVAGTLKDSAGHLQRYVDGKREGPPIVIPRASWEAGEREAWSLELLVTKARQGQAKVFVGACFEHADEPGGRCRQYRAMAFDPKTGALGPLLKKQPPNTTLSNLAQRGVPMDKLPKLAAPAGYTIKLHQTAILDGSAMMGDGRKVPSFTCSGPEGTATWPSADVINWEFITRPKTIRWVSHAPPLFVVSGPATNPIGQTSQSSVTFRGCSRQALEEVVFGPHGLWFESRAEVDGVIVTGGHWMVHLGPHELGQVPGDALFVVAPD